MSSPYPVQEKPVENPFGLTVVDDTGSVLCFGADPPPAEVYVADEEEDDGTGPRCRHQYDRHHMTATPKFDYFRFTEYLELVHEHERDTWRKREGMKLIEADDELLHNQLESIYGVMNRKSPLYSLIFQNYKEELDESMQESAQDPLVLTDPLLAFSEAEVEAFKRVLKKPRAEDLFLLPRPFQASKETAAQKMLPTEKDTKRKPEAKFQSTEKVKPKETQKLPKVKEFLPPQAPILNAARFSWGQVSGNRIPSDCMQNGEWIQSVSESMSPTTRGTTELGVLLLHYYTPLDFYVTLCENWGAFNKFQVQMNKDYRGFEGSLGVGPELIQSGLYVAVIRYEEGVREFCRGQIIEKLRNGNYKVLFVDYGETAEVEACDLRYLKKYLAHELRIQGIWCGLYNILPQLSWGKEVLDTCYNILSSHYLKFTVRFVNKIQLNGRNMWLVTAAGGDKEKYPDVGAAIRRIGNLMT